MSADDRPDPRLDRRDRRHDAAAWSCASRRGVVACAHFLAADAGAEALAAGGNAADAAVAAALALNVCEPAASGLAGMAMAVVHGMGADEPMLLDGACTAPAAATPARVAESHRYRGARAIAVPGAPAALAALHGRFGRVPLAELVRPAVRLARAGAPFSPLQRELATTYRDALLAGDAAWLALDGSGAPHAVGSRVPQPALADTLEQLGRAGFMDLYRGEVAEALAADLAARGAFVTREDLRAVAPPEPRPALGQRWGDQVVFTAGPPAGGLTLAQLIGMTDALGRALDLRAPDDLLLALRFIRRARCDRRRVRLQVGARDPGAAAALLEPDALADAAAAPLAGIVDAAGGETSHLCAFDGDGGSVAMTLSIERSYGAACMAPAVGLLYSGYLRAFKLKARRHPHYLRPGAPARSNAAPTLVFDREGGAARVAIGSTGSERMVSGIWTTLLRLRDHAPFDAVAAPRVHCTPEGLVLAELARLEPGCRARLGAGQPVKDVGPWAFVFGGLQVAVRERGVAVGVGEPRRDGGASSPEMVA